MSIRKEFLEESATAHLATTARSSAGDLHITCFVFGEANPDPLSRKPGEEAYHMGDPSHIYFRSQEELSRLYPTVGKMRPGRRVVAEDFDDMD